MEQATTPRQNHGPLAGVRVLEVSRGRSARIAGMLLADLGADVLRRIDPSAPPEPLTPATVCWDRGKSISPMAPSEVAGAAGAADVVIVDEVPSSLSVQGWDAQSLTAEHPALVHLWMPPYGERGEWRDLPEDPLMLAGLGGLAHLYPADDDSPIAPVIAGISHLHGAMGAAAAAAALVGRNRHGTGQACVVTGLHAAAVLVGTAYSELNDDMPFKGTRSSTGGPNWRVYRCADGQGVFLAALTPDLFFRALEALGRLDVMALPEVGGDWQAVFGDERGRRAVTAELEPVFASQSSAHWIARFAEARVPCAIAASRREWMDNPISRANDRWRELPHPDLGPVTTPNVPIAFSDTPGTVRGLARPTSAAWPGRPDTVATAAPVAAVGATQHSHMPLEGVRVVDGAAFVAGPMVSTLLADFGADVIRVEPPTGDTYRAYQVSFLAVNQRKRGVAIDLKQPEGRRALHDLLARSDIFVENLRPRSAAALDLGAESDPRFPHLVHCNVSAFGRAEAFADSPGFDPVVQSLSGMADAQGGDGGPLICSAPLNDVATGALGALGSLAALYHRGTMGRGQRLWVSLAASATFVQSPEFTTWAGSPAPQRGGVGFRGPHDGYRYHRCADGWIAVAAVTEDSRERLIAALEVEHLTDVGEALRSRTISSALTLLERAQVPACRVISPDRPLRDPFLVDNDFSHLVELPSHGVARVVDAHSRWPGAPSPRSGRYFEPGEDDEAVLGGVDPAARLTGARGGAAGAPS